MKPRNNSITSIIGAKPIENFNFTRFLASVAAFNEVCPLLPFGKVINGQAFCILYKGELKQSGVNLRNEGGRRLGGRSPDITTKKIM